MASSKSFLSIKSVILSLISSTEDDKVSTFSTLDLNVPKVSVKSLSAWRLFKLPLKESKASEIRSTFSGLAFFNSYFTLSKEELGFLS